MARETQRLLYQALKVHKFDLEITQGVTSGPDLEILDRRIEAARLLLEWLSLALELGPPASQSVQTPPSSSSPTDRNQIPQSASDPPSETSPTDRACHC
jgi:hypothetical protein